MFGTSVAFSDAIKNSHEVISYCEIWDDTGKIATVYPTSGSVSFDASASVRASASFTFNDPDPAGVDSIVPSSLSEQLAPGSHEIRPFRGVRLATGDEVVPLGVFRITKTSIAEDASGVTLSLECQDRAEKISATKFLDPYVLTAGVKITTAIANLVGSIAPWLSQDDINFDSSRLWGANEVEPVTTWALVDGGSGSDPWGTIVSMATQFGLDIYFDRNGALTLRKIPSESNPTVSMSLVEGDDCVILSSSKDFSIENTFNGVVLEMQSSDGTTGMRSVQWDSNPLSPTYYLGSFGQRPGYFTATMVASQTDLDDSAKRLLSKSLGMTEAVSWTMIVDPRLDPFDFVSIVREQTKTNDVFIVDKLEIPLAAADTMSVTARAKRAVDVSDGGGGNG
jgi:hypothetical protein